MMNRGGVHGDSDYIISVCKDMNPRLLVVYDIITNINSGSEEDVRRMKKYGCRFCEGIESIDDAKTYYNQKRALIVKALNEMKLGDRALVMENESVCRNAFRDIIKDDSHFIESVKKRE